MQPTSLEHRRSRIRLPMTEVAERAGVDKFTVRRCLTGERDTRSSKANAIEKVIVAEEIALLEHLASQHPGHVPAGPSA